MNGITLESIGLSQEELQNRVIGAICNKVLSGFDWDENGHEYSVSSSLAKKLQKEVQVKIDEAITKLGDKVLLPVLEEKIENFVIQTTNAYGEKKAEPKTFTEYLVERAENFLVEEVDANGRSRAECSRRNDSFYGAKGNRLTQAIDKHLSYSIDTMTKALLKDATSKLSVGLAEACKSALKEAQEKLQISVKV